MGLYFSDLADIVDRVRARNVDTSEIKVVLKDLATDHEIEVDDITYFEGFDKLVIEFDYEGS
jgi:hypothetical protein